MLKVGLIGVGGISGAHIPAWEAMGDAELVALCDVRPEMMEKYPEKRHYTDYHEMLRCEALDVVDICLPTYLHVDCAVEAMEHGCHVLCEKPISLKEADVERAYGAARKHGVRFMIAQVLRFWPEYTVLKEIIDSGRYGRLLSGYLGRLGNMPGWSWDGWMGDEQRSGLVPFDLHIHDLDFMVYALGEPAEVLTSRARRPEQDYIHAVYRYDDFFITAEAAWYGSPYPFGARFRFQFERAVVAMEFDGLKIYERDGGVLDLAQQDGLDTGDIALPKSDAYANEIRYFADCVKAGVDADKVKPEELKTVIRILNQFQ